MADPLKQPLTWSKAYPKYAEKHDMYRVFQELLKGLIMLRPDDPLAYIRDELPTLAQNVKAGKAENLSPRESDMMDDATQKPLVKFLEDSPLVPPSNFRFPNPKPK